MLPAGGRHAEIELWHRSHDSTERRDQARAVARDVTRFHQAEQITGGWKTDIYPGRDFLEEYMTVQAMRRLGT